MTASREMQISAAKKLMVGIAHQIYGKGLAPGKSGNISTKIYNYDPASTDPGDKLHAGDDDHTVLITPSGVSLRDVTLENVIVVDMDGNQLEGLGIPSSELPMHLEIYKKREDLQGIAHTHSPYATGFSFSGEKIPRLEGFGKIENPYIEEVEYAPPGSMKLAEIAVQGLLKEDAVILKNHGVLATGPNLDEAALLAEFIESIAKTVFIARILNRGPIPTHSKHSR